MVDTDQERVAEIEARANAASKGPWWHQPYGGQNQNGDYAGGYILGSDGEYLTSEISDEDGPLIAAARDDIPFLLGRLRTVEAERDAALAKMAHTEEDAWCRAESCENRHWRSGSMPTHRRGASCPAALSVPVVEDSGDSA